MSRTFPLAVQVNLSGRALCDEHVREIAAAISKAIAPAFGKRRLYRTPTVSESPAGGADVIAIQVVVTTAAAFDQNFLAKTQASLLQAVRPVISSAQSFSLHLLAAGTLGPSSVKGSQR